MERIKKEGIPVNEKTLSEMCGIASRTAGPTSPSSAMPTEKSPISSSFSRSLNSFRALYRPLLKQKRLRTSSDRQTRRRNESY